MEKEALKDLILRYGVLLGKRNTEKQKTIFLRAAQKQLEQEGFPVDITCVSASIMKRETMNMYNLYAGDFKQAEVVFITYYDTPLQQLLPKDQKAFDANWSRGNFLLHTLLFLLCMIGIAVLLYSVVIPELQQYGFMSIWGVVLVLVCLCGFYGIQQMRGGIAAKNNMVRNSSSLIALFALAGELSAQEKPHAAFALIDEGTRSEYGLKMLQEYIGKRKIRRVYLDSIGNTGMLQCFCDRSVKEAFATSQPKNIEWHDRLQDKEAYGDILLSAGCYFDGSVILKADKKAAGEQQISSTMHMLKKLIAFI